MPLSHNHCTLMGYLANDAELAFLPNQTPVVNFTLAVNKSYTLQGGEKREEVLFIDCCMFGKIAEVLAQARKGNPLFVEGHLKQNNWEGPDGTKRSKINLVLSSFQFLNGKPKPETDGLPVTTVPAKRSKLLGGRPKASGPRLREDESVGAPVDADIPF